MTNNSDAARVRAALDDGCLLHPDEGAASTVDLAAAIASLAGAPVDVSSAGQRELQRVVGRHEHYVFVMIDGLGMNLIDSLAADSFLRTHFAMELRAVFPSSTAPALTSIATARWPAEHAVIGWWTYLPDAGVTATILPYVERFSGKPLDRAKVPTSYAFPIAALGHTFSHAFMMFTPRAIAGSTYSRYSTGDAPFFGYEKLGDGVDAIIERITNAASPTYNYLYVPDVDFAEHMHGPHSRETAQALLASQAQVERLKEGLSGRARMVLTADHGQFTVGTSSILHRGDELVRVLTVPPTGDGRAPLFHVADGKHDAFAATFRERYGERFALLSTAEAESMRLFGPMPLSAETRRRTGDFIGVAFADDVILYEPTSEDRMRGHHGGLTPDEIRIPLIVA